MYGTEYIADLPRTAIYLEEQRNWPSDDACHYQLVGIGQNAPLSKIMANRWRKKRICNSITFPAVRVHTCTSSADEWIGYAECLEIFEWSNEKSEEKESKEKRLGEYPTGVKDQLFDAADKVRDLLILPIN